MELTKCSFEIAQLLKELYVNIPSDQYYNIGPKNPELHRFSYDVNNPHYKKNSQLWKGIVVAPSLELIAKYLREEEFIYLSIHVNYDNEGDEKIEWGYTIIYRYDNALHNDAYAMTASDKFDTYEQALNNAILDVLNELKNERTINK